MHSLVLRLNELFHDLQGQDYHHPEMQEEVARWKRLFPQKHGVFLDIGAGTGFIGNLLQQHLQKGDTLICADLSQEMLNCCQHLASDRYNLKLLKLHHEKLPLPDSSVDVVTMNSVLHHIPNTKNILSECARVLRPGGMLMIGHEPNIRFCQNMFLRWQRSLLHYATPKRILMLLLKALRVYPKVCEDSLTQKINNTLMQEGYILQPLSAQEISALVDIHSPTAGGLHTERGFDPSHLLDPSVWKIRTIETYQYLPKGRSSTGIFGMYNTLLQKIFPNEGALFFLTAKKV